MWVFLVFGLVGLSVIILRTSYPDAFRKVQILDEEAPARRYSGRGHPHPWLYYPVAAATTGVAYGLVISYGTWTVLLWMAALTIATFAGIGVARLFAARSGTFSSRQFSAVLGSLLAVASVAYYFWVWNESAAALEAHKYYLAGNSSATRAIMKSQHLSSEQVLLASVVMTRAQWVMGTGLAAGAVLLFVGISDWRRKR